ncbi:MAG: Nif11-like leader peptide family natural product precursor [Chlorobiaceae bacterium]|jgi:predicted metal-dependent hydrolase
MAGEQAKKFVHQLKSDHELRYRLEAFIAEEGYSFKLHEIVIAECEDRKERCTNSGYKRRHPDLCGYEHWAG